MAHRRVGAKVASLREVAEEVKPGWMVTVGGFAHSVAPMALVRELVRLRTGKLDLTGIAECWAADFLAGAGALARVRFSNFMFEGFGRCHNFSRGVESGTIAVEDHSHFGIVTRLAAAGLGVPFLPIRSMTGTDILDVPGFEDPACKSARVDDPFGGPPVTVVSAVAPDAALVHAARADRDGNVQIFGSTAVIEEQCRAARRVYVTVEELVDTAEIRRHPELTILPGFMVDAVVEAPFGAHPTGVYRYYEHDAAHIQRYYEASRKPDGFRAYLDEFVYGLPDEWAYLEKIGPARLLSLRVDPTLGYIPRRATTTAPEPPAPTVEGTAR